MAVDVVFIIYIKTASQNAVIFPSCFSHCSLIHTDKIPFAGLRL